MDPHQIAQALERLRGHPAAALLASVRAYAVGGAVRDALRGEELTELDVVIDGDLDPLIERLGVTHRIEVADHHTRFGTATVALDGERIDLTRSRRERYEHPGALPEVSPAPIRADLGRRDFTVNAMAVPLSGPAELLDPYDGLADLDARRIRVLHRGSFRDDPTRAIRAARYSARLRMDLDPETAALVEDADLSTVSTDRVEAEVRRTAREQSSPWAFALLDGWGVMALGQGRLALISSVSQIAGERSWVSDAERADAIAIAVTGGPALDAAVELGAASPETPSKAVALGAPHGRGLLLLALAAGASWVDPYLNDWSRVRLAIGGQDLMDAGIPEGPAVGAGLRSALVARLDGELGDDPEEQLEVALEAARGAI